MNYKKTEWLLYNHKSSIAEIKNIDIEIFHIKSQANGIPAQSYSEYTAPTNAFHSTVESEVIIKEKEVEQLEKRKAELEYWTSKINNAVESLDDRMKQIIKLKYFDKINNTTIANRLDLTEVWICKLKNDALNQISKLILINN